MTALAFCDTETTHLDPRFGDVWEVAVIRREPDGYEHEWLWQVRPDLTNADPEALKIGRYEERFAASPGWAAATLPVSGEGWPFGLTLPEFLSDLQETLKDTVMVGSNPAFDDAFLKKLLHAHGRRIGWHYRTVDIATLAAGYVQGLGDATQYPGELHTPPYSSRDLSRAVGVEPPGDDVAHTALGDARWARDVYLAVTGQPAAERAA